MAEDVRFREAQLRRDTRVLFRVNDGHGQYLMTNECNEIPSLLRVFAADIDGKIYMEGYLLGSLYAHDPYIIPHLEEMNCTFGELNPGYFERNVVVDGLLGQAVGDAFGVPFEFLSRKAVRRLDLQDMMGNDCPLPIESRWGDLIPQGAWSDDTSMTVAAMASIVEQQGRIDYDDIMQQFVAWWYEGKHCALDFPFGLGGNVGEALDRYRRGVPAVECGGTGFRDNGNGALMRIFPFSMYCILNGLDDGETLAIVRRAAGITHAHEITAMSCYLYTLFLRECLRTKNPERAYHLVFCEGEAEYQSLFSDKTRRAHCMLFERGFDGGFDVRRIPESGYVVDSLAVAVYSVLHTGNYEDAVKMAVGFGYDTDTNAAIAGSIAGAMYGQEQIPARWLSVLRKKDDLVRLAERFASCAMSQPALS